MSAMRFISDPHRGQSMGRLPLSAPRPAAAYEVDLIHLLDQPRPGRAADGVRHRGGLRGVGLRRHWGHGGLAPPPGSSAQDVGPCLPPCLAP
jgi:hypothetical protein